MAQFSTDFSEYSINDDPTVDGPAEWSVPWETLTAIIKSDATHGNYVEIVPDPHGGYFAIRWDNILNTTQDYRYLALFRRGGQETTGTWMRGSGSASSENAYRSTLRNNSTDARLSSVVGGSLQDPPTLHQHGLPSNGVNVWIWVRGEVVGNNAKVKWWADGDPEPGSWHAEIAFTDHASGWFGIGGWESGAEVARDFAWVGVGTDGDVVPTGASLYESVDDDPASPDDNDWVNNAVDVVP